MRHSFQSRLPTFRGGQISHRVHVWEALTSDREILKIVLGAEIDFIAGRAPIQHTSYLPTLSSATANSVSVELDRLLQHKIITPCGDDEEEFVSPIFPTVNNDGGTRIILNLKKLNEHVVYHHFKMDTIKTILQQVTPGCYMASLDLKSAYYSVRVSPPFRKYLKFVWQGHKYQFTCFPNGLSSCPRKFTKLLKVPLTTLRTAGHIIFGYIDDFHLQGDTVDECFQTVLDSVLLFESLGFVIHPEKSHLRPSQTIQFLGFVIDSVNMIVSLTDDKKCKLKALILEVLSSVKLRIRLLACLIGKLVSSFPACPFGPLYYRQLEKDKIAAVKLHKGNYDKFMVLSADARSELHWWHKYIDTMSAPIQQKPITVEIATDASMCQGWGAVLEELTTGGAWDAEQQDLHINVKEMMAIYYALRSFVTRIQHQHVRVLCDNTTAVAVINKMGTSHSARCNAVSQKIWHFCQTHDIWVTCAHIPGIENVQADFHSRKEYKQAEWMLNPAWFKSVTIILNFTPTIDCFATRLNAQLPTYAAFQPDPYATIIDAFSFNWTHHNCYVFPPFSIIPRVLQKIRVDQATVLCVFPRWPTQTWWPFLQRMMVTKPLIIPPAATNLVLPNHPDLLHPLHQKLHLFVCVLSGHTTGPKV